MESGKCVSTLEGFASQKWQARAPGQGMPRGRHWKSQAPTNSMVCENIPSSISATLRTPISHMRKLRQSYKDCISPQHWAEVLWLQAGLTTFCLLLIFSNSRIIVTEVKSSNTEPMLNYFHFNFYAALGIKPRASPILGKCSP